MALVWRRLDPAQHGAGAVQRPQKHVGVTMQLIALAGCEQDVRGRPVPCFERQPQAAAAADQFRAGPQSQAQAFRFKAKGVWHERLR